MIAAAPLHAVPAVEPLLLGRSAAMVGLRQQPDRIARSRATVLITGDTDTGKEMVARYLHLKSPRRDKPFVALNCAALPEALIESELFGHARGAFTGAHRAYPGKIRLAAGGTLLLDEIGDMAPAAQVRMLRFLERPRSSAWVRCGPRRCTCASSPPPTRTWASACVKACSARTSTTA